ncbi:Lipopolysaccharide export system permease protein LptG [Candidatus Erwinia haradaeae]|uniref:Lipopolysaccharide export system permease protein LptG n=1 Tax=Candidatus Erwinia haradaeae TaxID=1922217 RepID=A0A451D042_9GAMM|nr:LPS export ABC transporter permease LptG [Candidatus Erwinia haradaeae]VFP78920.1 Lipopolysaccharide export system permease protein LptG [Candidatus Erwinia haradaeae]
MFGILDKYIGKTMYKMIMTTLFLLVSLSSMIKFFDQLRQTGKGEYTALSAFVYTLLTIPKDIEIFLPMATLLGVLIGLGSLVRHREIVVMQASGFTRIKITRSVIKTAIPLMLLSLAGGEFIAPQGEAIARTYRANKLTNHNIVTTKSELWAKDNNDFIFIEHICNNKTLLGVSIYSLGYNHKLQNICYASSAIYNINKKAWNLKKVSQSNLSDPNQIKNIQILNKEWKTSLTPDKLDFITLDPATLSISGLYRYISYLEQSGQITNLYQLNMWGKISQPLAVAAMMIMALSFIFGPLKNMSTTKQIVIGGGLGSAFYLINQIFRPLSLIYHIPPIPTVVLPSAIFFSISIILLEKWKQ